MPLIYSDGEILRLNDNAMPVEQELFLDPSDSGILKLTNHDRKAGYLAIFAAGEDKNTTAGISPSMIKGLEKGRYLVYDYYEKTFIYAEYNDIISIEFSDYKLYIFIPLGRNLTVIGRSDKYIGTHAIKDIWEGEKESRIHLRESGEFSFAAERAPGKIYVNGRLSESNLCIKGNLYTMKMEQILRDVELIIEF